MIPREEPPNLAEVKLRQEIEDEVYDDITRRQAADALNDRDKRFFALAVTIAVLAGVTLPLLALVLGLSWRLVKWAAGCGW